MFYSLKSNKKDAAKSIKKPHKFCSAKCLTTLKHWNMILQEHLSINLQINQICFICDFFYPLYLSRDWWLFTSFPAGKAATSLDKATEGILRPWQRLCKFIKTHYAPCILPDDQLQVYSGGLFWCDMFAPYRTSMAESSFWRSWALPKKGTSQHTDKSNGVLQDQLGITSDDDTFVFACCGNVKEHYFSRSPLDATAKS